MNSFKISFLFITVLFLAGCTDLKEKSPPNIVWITAEDITTMLGSYGDPNARTPHLDAFAEKSIRFTSAYATAPVCMPARSAIITGVHAVSLGTQHLRSDVEVPEFIPRFPKLLRKRGYFVTNNDKENSGIYIMGKYEVQGPTMAYNKELPEQAEKGPLLLQDHNNAVEIATPDHWHAIPVLMAAAAKKDIYCQKPLSLTIAEGRAMSDAVKHHGIVFQTGSQQRSNAHFRRICELVVNGRIGELKQVVCGLPSGTPDFGRKAHLIEPAPVPKGFNYDMWLGQAPEVPYRPCASHVNFRWVLDYSGGQLTDWGGHHPDIAQWGMQTQYSGPVRIQNPRSKWSNHPVYNTATDFYFESIYENGVEMIISSDAEFGVTFIGTEGKVWSSRQKHTAEPESLTETEIGPDEIHLYKSDNHFRNFIDCVISREEPIAPVEVAHRSITIAHLGNIAMMLGQDLEWYPKAERVLNVPEANEMLSRTMREPWDAVYKEFQVKPT